MSKTYDYLIIGSGIIGMSIARALKIKRPHASVIIIDKEKEEACHASSRNSGVLHAGFYYTADSLKARFTVEGNRALKAYCRKHHLPVNECGKLVVAQNEEELEKLFELEKRGKKNGSDISMIPEEKARDIEPNVVTHKKALWSPGTASVDPKLVCSTLRSELTTQGVEFRFNTKYIRQINFVVETSTGDIHAQKTVNCGGLYADKIAHDFGFGQSYTMIPFKGLYLKYTKNKTDVKVNIYPVPNLKNPFLGVHFTKTVTGDIKIGPTAIPAFWRENYDASNVHLGEMVQVLSHEAKLFLSNAFGFRDLAFEEMHKYNKNYFISLAQKMVSEIDPKGFTEYTKPGIRAQLLDKREAKLVQDFVIEGDDRSTHVLNAVSPAFTCAFPFAEHIVENRILS
jgi:(S)-2-hydroxyglutarate dehydrogenase